MRRLLFVGAWGLMWFVALVAFGLIGRVMWEVLSLGWHLL
jgi:hypothetical protein